MEWVRFRKSLDAYAAYLQGVYKSGVQVRTGELQDSIKVWCTIEGNDYRMHINLRNYWKWIPQSFPLEKAFRVGGTEIPEIHRKQLPYWATPQPDTVGARYKIDYDFWQSYLNAAFEEDLTEYIGLRHSQNASRLGI